MVVSLKELEAMVDALGPADRARLLQYLIPRVSDGAPVDKPGPADAAGAWREFRRVGERLAATSNGQSITQSISDMRR